MRLSTKLHFPNQQLQLTNSKMVLRTLACHGAFGDPSNLNKRTRIHTENGMAFKCHLCGKLLIRKRDLDRHLASRHTTGNCDGILPSVFRSEEIDAQTVLSDSEFDDQVTVDE